MKKHLSLLLALVMLLSLTLALAEGEAVINPELNKEQMKNIKGELITIDKPENLKGEVDLGYFYLVPEHLNGQDMESSFVVDRGRTTHGYKYIPKDLLELYYTMNDIVSDEEYYAAYDKVAAASVKLFSVLRVNPAKKNSDEVEAQFKKTYQHMDLLAVNGEDKIFIAYNKDFGESQQPAEEQAAMLKFVEDGIEMVKSTLMLFPPIDYYDYYGAEELPMELDGTVADFAAQDLYGKDFSPEEFAKYDLTLVNVWYTGCPPCIDEMPDLQALSEALPENVNLIAVCLDGEDENELAVSIIENAGVTFTHLKGEQLIEGVLKNLIYTPTTLFLDNQGNQVGAAIVGAMGSPEKFVEQALKIVKARLEMIGK